MLMSDKDLYLKIGRPNNACAVCGSPITHAGKHPSVLLPQGAAEPALASGAAVDNAGDELPGLPAAEADNEGPRRRDYCAECWQKQGEQQYFSYWMARREPPKTRKIETKKERNAGVLAWFDLLRSQKPDDDNLQAQFFLAHLLMKYGVLKWNRTVTELDGSEMIYFRQTGTEDDIPVLAVDLSDEKSVDIKRQLDEYLLQYANTQGETEPVAVAGEPRA